MEPLINVDPFKKVGKSVVISTLLRKYPLAFILFFIVQISIPIVILFILLFLVSLSSTNEDRTEVPQDAVSSGFPAYAKSFIPIYQAAGKKYGVPWNILAAIHKIETDFGRNLSVSSVGAKGHTQFMDKTWLGWGYPGGTRLGDLPDYIDITDPTKIAKYGGYGVDGNGDGKADPYHPTDAIFATAKYLVDNHQLGADWFARKGAVWQYNHDYEHYVVKVKQYAREFVVPTEVASTDSFLFPISGGKVTSLFGSRFHPIRRSWRHHDGIDIAKGKGSPILAIDHGKVVESRKSSGYGWKIVIEHENNLQTTYAHMYPKDVYVQVGQVVQKGQTIALVGSNGWSTGPHLHFEVEKNGQLIDPMVLFKK